MRYITLLMFVLVFISPVFAENLIRFDIGGIKIGDKITEKFAYSHCPAKDKGKSEIICHKSIKIDGGDVFVIYFFDDFKLVGASLSFKSSIFGDIVSAYTNKFGQPPHNSKEVELITRAGVKYINEIKSWNTDSGEFVIEKYGNSVDEGYAYIHSSEYEKYLNKKKSNLQQKLGEQL